MMYRHYIKRMLDFLLALTAMVLLSPVYLMVAILVRIKLGSPVLFTQERPGLHEKIFKLYKFRTMTSQTDDQGNLLPDDQRLTQFGKLLRSTSLDELPELYNILKGDMSIVGPRPLLVAYLPYYKKEERARHDVRPGLTGYAQINGRNSTPWEIRLKQDIYYVENVSFGFDFKIILLTVLKVIKRSDVLVGSEIPAGRLDDSRKGIYE